MAIENQEIAELVGRYFAACNAGDMQAAAQLDGKVGFGFRTTAWRGRLGVDTWVGMLKKWWDSLEYFRAELEELSTSSDGSVGFAWGFHGEKFKVKGRPDEQVRVRFSHVYKKDGDKWQCIMYHRDIQPFDEDGRYVPRFTTA
jgi:ketosteroid isomerase-like protein